MPLPWKKAKGGSRISRLVADLQSPPKRGGSLVVETGFPTSLVDLFVKNRDRLKKQSKKKSQSQPPLEISRPMNATPPPPCYNNDRMLILSSGCEGIEPKNETKSNPVQESGNPVQESVIIEECHGDQDSGEDESKTRNVSAAIFRVFLVVVLALSTKTLAVGITTSAFLLLLLEFVGTSVLCYLRPCSKASTVFVFFVEKVKILCFSKCNKEEIERCEEDSTKACSNGVCNSSVGEIQVVESTCVAVMHFEEITNKETDLEPVIGDGRARSSDMENKEKINHKNEEKVDVLVCKKEQRRSAKMKATFVKKLVPKKLRPSKKGKQMKEKEMESNGENRSLGEEKSTRVHRPQNRDKQEHDDEDELSRSRHEESDDGITTQSQTESEVTTVEETRERERERERERKGNSGYLVLCLIVLAGLIGGRVLALALTVGWCLALKLVRKLGPITVSS